MTAAPQKPGRDAGVAYDSAILRRLWRYILPYRRDFWLAAILLPVTAAFALAQPYILKLAIDRYIAGGDAAGILRMGLAYGVTIGGEFTLFYWQYFLTMQVAQRSLADLRADIFAHVQRLDAAFFDQQPTGSLVTRLTTDIDVINEMFASGGMTLVMDAITLLGIGAVMLALDWRLACASLALMPVLLGAIDFFRRKARVNYRRIRERIAKLNAYLQEAISGIAVIQLFAREAAAFTEFSTLNEEHNHANHSANTYEAALFSFVESLASISGALAVWYATHSLVGTAIAVGTLVAFLEYIQKLFVPIRDFSSKYAVMQSAMAAAERVFELLDRTPSIVSPNRLRDVRRDETSVAIQFEGVSFSYKPGHLVLHDVSFEVKRGERVAIVGHTGSGKSTIIKLLNRSYDVTGGTIRVDGLDVRDWDLSELRRRIGVVSQDVFLFSGTIRENLCLGEAIDHNTLVRHAESVHADAFIRRLPMGYDEALRERGSNLSVGQKQLLSFARALAYDPEILVLDEATSSIDAETETLIEDAVRHLMEGRTTLAIAHRLSTIERADRIIVLNHGEIRESGTHRELLRHGGLYAKLHKLQRYSVESRDTAQENAAHY